METESYDLIDHFAVSYGLDIGGMSRDEAVRFLISDPSVRDLLPDYLQAVDSALREDSVSARSAGSRMQLPDELVEMAERCLQR